MITDNVEMPVRGTKYSAGYDFYAPRDIELIPGRWERVDTMVRFDGSEKVYAPAPGRTGKVVYNRWVMLLFPRSGLGRDYRMRLANTVGVIDQDYRNNILVDLTVDKPILIKKGERFMQGVIVPFGMLEEEETPRKERTGGHGSTGA